MNIQNLAGSVAASMGRQSAVIRSLRPWYETVLHLVHGRRGIPWKINGLEYRVSPYHRTRLGQSYDAGVAEFLSQRIKPGAVCLDVGANVGVYVLQLARWSGPDGKVIAFEPNPAARKILCQHIAWNGLEDRVSVESTAIGSKNETTTMFAHEADGMSRLGEANVKIAERTRGLPVSVTTLSDYCESRKVNPDWVVIDIEGFEIQALIGFERYLKAARNSVGIILEMHPNVWSSADTSIDLAQEVLARLGRRPVALSGQRNIWSEHGHIYLEAAPNGANCNR